MRMRFGRILLILVVLFGAGYLVDMNYPGIFDGVTGYVVGSGSVDVDIYVMSQCPYGVMAENEFGPVMDLLGDYVNLNVEYIGRSDGTNFQSLHGQPEVDANMIQLCAKKHYPEKYFDFILCQNKAYQDIASTIEPCADELGLDADVLVDCMASDEAKTMLTDSFEKAALLGVQGSPTIYVNGEQHEGGRDALSLKNLVCSLIDAPECQGVPKCEQDFHCESSEMIGVCVNGGCEYTEPVAVKLYVISSDECTNCDTTQILTMIKKIFKGTKVVALDAEDSEAVELIDSLGIKYLPAYVFNKELADTVPFQTEAQLRAAFAHEGDYYRIHDQATGAAYLIDEEEKARLRGLLDLGDKPQIDFFVMSYCPYGDLAEEAIAKVYDMFGDKVKFVPHYVIYSNYQGGGPNYCIDSESKYCSMHGVQEMSQGIRELCVYEISGIGAYFDFVKEMNVKCDYKNADECYVDVASGLELDVSAISSCEKSRGEELAAKDLALGTAFGVRGSPTIFIGGDKYNGVRSPAGYQSAVCKLFDEAPSECDLALSSAGQITPNAGCGS